MRKYTGTPQSFVMLEEDEVPAWPMAMPVPARALAALKVNPRVYWDREDGIAIPATQVRMALGMGLAVIRRNIKDHLFTGEEVVFIATQLHPKGMYHSFRYVD